MTAAGLCDGYCCIRWLGARPEVAASCGHVECLVHMHREQGHALDRRAMVAAAAGHGQHPPNLEGRLRCLQYMRDEGGVPWHDSVVYHAALNDNLPCLDFAIRAGCPVHPRALSASVVGNSTACLAYLLGLPPPQRAVAGCDLAALAAQHGHLDCLVLLREHGCPWDAGTCAAAAGCRNRRDGMRCLRYARAHGCPWDERALLAACASGNVAAARFALAGGLKRSSPLGGTAVADAAATSHFIVGVARLDPFEHCDGYLGRLVLLPLRLRAAVAALELAWLDRMYRPGGVGATKAAARFARAAALQAAA